MNTLAAMWDLATSLPVGILLLIIIVLVLGTGLIERKH